MTPVRRPARSRSRALLFRAAVLVIFALGLVTLLELGTRVFVSKETFHVLANVYASDPDAKVRYTFRRGFAGEAFGVPLATNSLGHRGREWPAAKPPGTLRIALIGDSHAFGFGVAFEDTLGELLAKRLEKRLGKPVEVMNFGVNGYNAKQELAVLETRALPLAPDLVLVLPCNNDDDPAMWADDEGFLRLGSGEVAGLDRRQESFARFRRSVLGKSRFLLWLRIVWYRYSVGRAQQQNGGAQTGPAGTHGPWLPPAGTGPVPAALREPVYEPLAALAALCRARGVGVAVLSYTAAQPWREMLNAFAAQEHVPLLELVALLDGVSDYEQLLRKWSLGWDSHMGAAAQRRWAEGVEEFLVRNSLVR